MNDKIDLDKLKPILSAVYEAGRRCEKEHQEFERNYPEGTKRPDLEMPSFEKWFIETKITYNIITSD